ncbi:ribose-phosphate pyrophosphokinase [Hujiaoplasma nucleasis]|uniref:Ribose-phosphate pyrophosphokinase n=2 Tax=Hujiaoplasma nucleasis TaxID=2725268 RepID=A0A7L6N592_9MOLU|nr:ribose-phosphate pyrophosphokinase [Hujiaoplasma nucleasis]QLY40437.1 ribose-phosphate pyrophosphokinase [Hujiaoplasma nucleasis]
MALFHGSKVKLFSLSSNVELAQGIAEHIGIPISECLVTRFADGEISIDIPDTVRGHKVFVVQSTSAPVNEHLMELLIMIDALRRASAREVNIVMPYYGYSRQDRKARARQPISAKLVADLLQTAGATRVLSMDLHAPQIQGFFDIPIDNFRALPILVEYLQNKNLENICVVSPDHGGVARARDLADILQAPIAIIDKMRPEPNVAEVMNIIGKVKNKTCIVIDDMIDTGGSIVAASKALKDAGANEVYACCTHPLLSRNAPQILNDSDLKEVICTNTVELPEYKRFPKLVQLSIAELIGEGIIHIIDDKGVSSLFTKDFRK